MSFIEICRKAVSIDSSQTHGNGDVAVYYGELCREAGLSVEFHDEMLNGLAQKNIVAKTSSRAGAEFELIYQAHIDTSDPGIYAYWTKTEANPFNASIYGDELYGLGVADGKIDFLCKLQALKEVGVKNLKKPFALIGTYGEKEGMAGAIKLIRKTKLRSKLALIGGSTGNRLVTGSVGLARVEIYIPFSEEEIESRKNHDLQEGSSSQSKIFYNRESGLTPLKQNPVSKMIDYLGQLPEGIILLDLDGGLHYNTVPETAYLEFDLDGRLSGSAVSRITGVLKGLLDLEDHFREIPIDGYEPPFTPINMGTIRTDQDGIKMTGCCRITSEVGEEKYEAWMRGLKQHCSEYGSRFSVSEYKKPFFTSLESQFYLSCEKLLKEIHSPGVAKKVSSTTEASVFSRMGTECLIFGPGESLNLTQAANEKVSLADLETSIWFYKQVLENSCL